jgi:hypothetical protein
MKKPKNLITKERAIELCEAHAGKHKAISSAIGKQDNRSTWYSLEELKEYIAYIETQGREKGYNVDGIRFYIGSYPENDRISGKSNSTTIFLAPTGNKVTRARTMKMAAPTASPDITEIGPFNFGHDGNPPGSDYPN